MKLRLVIVDALTKQKDQLNIPQEYIDVAEECIEELKEEHLEYLKGFEFSINMDENTGEITIREFNELKND